MPQQYQMVLLNEIAKNIYIIEDYTQMRIALVNALTSLVPSKVINFYLAARDGVHILAEPVSMGCTQESLQHYIDKHEKSDFSNWYYTSGKSMIYRETDMFPDRFREQSDLYQDMYLPGGIHYSMQVCIAMAGKLLGILSLYRSREDGDFTDEEMWMLELLKTHLEARAAIEEAKHEMTAEKQVDRHGRARNALEFIESHDLTVREAEVLGMLFEGCSNDTICNALSISLNTLKKHTGNIYKKLGINNRWELIHF